MGRFAIVTIKPNDQISDADLKAELKRRLESPSLSIDHIAIIDDRAPIELIR